MPRYSVIIPAYNRAQFLPRCIKSVARQDCVSPQDIEILLLDDGSADNTPQVAQALSAESPFLKYVRLDHVGEPGTVRNHGLRMATGDFIAYCDSDDYWLPHHLATAGQAFKRMPHLGMVSNLWAMAHFSVTPHGIATSIVMHPHPPTVVNTNCRVHRRTCIEQCGYFNTKKWGEDQDFFQQIETQFPTYKTGIVSTVNGYIKGGNNLTYMFDQGVKRRYY